MTLVAVPQCALFPPCIDKVAVGKVTLLSWLVLHDACGVHGGRVFWGYVVLRLNHYAVGLFFIPCSSYRGGPRHVYPVHK